MIEQTLNAEEEMMTTRSVNEASIVALRDKAMAMLKQGAWHDDGKGHRLLIRETEDLRWPMPALSKWGRRRCRRN
jgi:hypothetical protein